MDSSNQAPNPKTSNTSNQDSQLVQELGHITQEVYKKNFELAQTNRTMSLLQKINEIILSSVTDVKQIALQVVYAIAIETEFKSFTILLLNKQENILERVAVSQTESLAKTEALIGKPLRDSKIPLAYNENLIIKAINEKREYETLNMADVLIPNFSTEDSKKIQETLGIKSTLIYPLIVREETIGAITVGIGQTKDHLSAYHKDLLYRLVGVIGIAIDNALLYTKIQEANESLLELDKLKNEFVSLASHELRTPMTAIKSYIWMVLENQDQDKIPDKQRYYLERAYKSTNRLIDLVNDMLNVSRIESGKITLNMQQLNMNEIIADILAELTPRSDELGVKISYIPPQSLPDVQADPDKIKEVLMNLVGNSLKFTPTGGSIAIATLLSDGMIETKITDTGVGIAKEDVSKLFQKFSIVGEQYIRKTNTQSTGLGLYICKSLVELHGGRIWVESEGINKGSTFHFTLRAYDKNKQTNQV